MWNAARRRIRKSCACTERGDEGKVVTGNWQAGYGWEGGVVGASNGRWARSGSKRGQELMGKATGRRQRKQERTGVRELIVGDTVKKRKEAVREGWENGLSVVRPKIVSFTPPHAGWRKSVECESVEITCITAVLCPAGIA